MSVNDNTEIKFGFAKPTKKSQIPGNERIDWYMNKLHSSKWTPKMTH